MSQIIKRAYEIVGLGKIGSNSHPVHPVTVHFPLAFLMAANLLNVLYSVAIYFPSLSPIETDKANVGTLTILGYFLNIAGIITAIPAVSTGIAELYAIINGRGLFIEGTKTLEPVVKTTLIHAAVSDMIVAGAVYNWLMERNRPEEDYRPYGHQLLLSVLSLVMLGVTGYLGGSLVYEHAVGVQRMGSAAEKKKKGE